MRKFYKTYRDLSNLPMPLAKLPWSFNCLLIDKVEDIVKRLWYGKECLNNGWSYIVLDHQIDSQLYERKADNSIKHNNFANNLPNIQGELAIDMMKDPYIFEIAGLSKKYNEEEVEKAIIEKIKVILLELGEGFSFVGNQYRISTPNKDYYIDLLFYHLTLNCFVVVELKNTDFDPSYIGQLQFYVTAVDETVKRKNDNPTIGLLLCKGKDKYSVDWSLKSTNTPVGVTSYQIAGFFLAKKKLINI